ncbi:type II toxin-antitoxin system antitoxin SocA domain-containing protein, partial [Lysinibacillus sp. fls2-241-R2A-57]|uniref:type II toxin-antitoxin system antitoxin SocA domain-containing protein n=1 Tax=Lysinibacillus sp. fls2-241-R2A-57 TaxID=3040292 RepID=UPI0025552550
TSEMFLKKVFNLILQFRELFHRQFDIENQDKAFQLYREEYDIISPDEIKKLRDKYNLNQREFSQLLGFGEITISRYERGSLPTLAQNQIIKDSTDPNTMLKLLEKNSEKISETKSNELKIILENLLQENKYEERIISTIRDIFHHDPDIYSGNKSFDFNKFSNMVWFFSKKDRPYLTKLNKLMFYADYYFFKKYSESISGGKYIRDYYGPVPEKFQTLYDNVKDIEIVENEHGSYINPISDKSEKEIFNDQELEILNFVYKKFKNMYANEIKDFSHEEKCWIEISNKSLIPYSYAEDLDMNRNII